MIKIYVLVDFYATWCGPCRAIAPKLQQFEVKYPNVAFVKVDVDEAEDLSREIQSMPTFQFFVDGVLTKQIEGADSSAIEALILKLNN